MTTLKRYASVDSLKKTYSWSESMWRSPGGEYCVCVQSEGSGLRGAAVDTVHSTKKEVQRLENPHSPLMSPQGRGRHPCKHTHTHTHFPESLHVSTHTVQQDPKTTGKLLVWDLRLPWVSLMTACSHAFILGTLTSAHLHIKHQHMLERVHMHHCHTHTREMCEWINSCCSSSREWVATNSQQQDL